MTYVRTTRDEWDIEQDCGYGWDVVGSEDSSKEARARLKEYRENQPEFAVRAVKRRIPIEIKEKK